jgi:hypothetical protein
MCDHLAFRRSKRALAEELSLVSSLPTTHNSRAAARCLVRFYAALQSAPLDDAGGRQLDKFGFDFAKFASSAVPRLRLNRVALRPYMGEVEKNRIECVSQP